MDNVDEASRLSASENDFCRIKNGKVLEQGIALGVKIRGSDYGWKYPQFNEIMS